MRQLSRQQQAHHGFGVPKSLPSYEVIEQSIEMRLDGISCITLAPDSSNQRFALQEASLAPLAHRREPLAEIVSNQFGQQRLK